MSDERIIDGVETIEGEDFARRAPRRLSIAEGRIQRVEAGAAGGNDRFVMPALVNAHDHARPVRMSSFGASGAPLELWLQFLKLVPAVDPYLAAAASLGRSALGGCGSVMVHHTRVQDPDNPAREAAEIARAARDIGLRIGFAVALGDRNPLVYGDHGPLLDALPAPARHSVERRMPATTRSPTEQMAFVDEVAEATEGPLVNVQYGPTGVQWCSDALLEAVAEASARTGRGVHMHFMETAYQRRWADGAYPGGVVPFLRDIGLLGPRLTLAHCTHVRRDELDMIAESGATIAVNTSSNLGLRSGIAPVREMLAAGCRVALGLDGMSFNEDDDALSEMRLMHSLHQGVGFEVDVDQATSLRSSVRNGWRSVSGHDTGGAIEAGAPADLLVIDRAKLDDDGFVPGFSPVDLLFARGRKSQIAELIVGGRSVVREGAVLGIDHEAVSAELRAQIRGDAGRNEDLREALAPLGQAMARHFGAAPCC